MLNYKKYIKAQLSLINFYLKKLKNLKFNKKLFLERLESKKKIVLEKFHETKIEIFKRLSETQIKTIYFSVFLIFLFISFKPKTDKLEKPRSVDTMIPQGYVLIPIEIANIESLNSLLEGYGKVNLYTFSSYTQKPAKLIAKNIKIIESPKQNGNYAILSPDEKAKFILSHPQPFFVTLRNPMEQKTVFKKTPFSRKRVIEILYD